uniref:VQ domain-containing protein n=1 Tax=Davidia involucrata TaxID=16924 RepID=A0A5B6ZZ43_DAVIN
MTSSENLDPWMFRPTFADSWISEAFARDTETLTKALQKSLSNHSETIMSSDAISPFFNLVKTETPTAQTPSFSSSDPDTAAPKRRNPIPITNSIGKTTKRKSRASKRTTTTFITADPANFRQMVQQVTGVRFGSGQLPVAPLLKPEPQRPVNRLQGFLPTLDTSAFLLDHNQQVVGPSSAAVHPSSLTIPAAAVADGGSGLDFDSFSNFPTLESWKVM